MGSVNKINRLRLKSSHPESCPMLKHLQRLKVMLERLISLEIPRSLILEAKASMVYRLKLRMPQQTKLTRIVCNSDQVVELVS